MVQQSKEVGAVAGLYAGYLAALTARPVLTKSVTQFVFSTAQELTAQHLSGAKVLDYDRSIKLGLYGFLISSPYSHYMIEFMNHLLSGLQPGGLKTLLQLLFANGITIPISVTLYVIALGVLDGKSPQHIQQSLKVIPSIVKRLWVVYPPFQIIIYKYAPPQLWLPLFQVYSFIIGVFTALAAKKAAAAAAAAAAQQKK